MIKATRRRISRCQKVLVCFCAGLALHILQVGGVNAESAISANHWPDEKVQSEQKNCKMKLAGIAISYKALPAFGGPEACGAAAPLEVNAIAGVAISPPIITNCDMAEALYGWIGTSLAMGAVQDLGKQLVRVNTASDYVCRRRNNLGTGKLSEHGKANALDIASLQFSDGSVMSIKGDWSILKAKLGVSNNAAYLKRIRRDACIRFTTVLGPGSDVYHGDHFHVDLAERRNGYRICN